MPFCNSCGSQLDGTENVCTNCGIPVFKNRYQVSENQIYVQNSSFNPNYQNFQQPYYYTNQVSTNNKSNKLKVGIIVGASIFTVALIVVLAIVFGSSKKGTSGHYSQAGGDYSGKTMEDYYYEDPESVMKYFGGEGDIYATREIGGDSEFIVEGNSISVILYFPEYFSMFMDMETYIAEMVANMANNYMFGSYDPNTNTVSSEYIDMPELRTATREYMKVETKKVADEALQNSSEKEFGGLLDAMEAEFGIRPQIYMAFCEYDGTVIGEVYA